jgi:hypothetical protein
MNRSTTVKREAVWIVVSVALVTWAVLALFHPEPDAPGGIYTGLHDEVGRWLFIHSAQLMLAPFVAFAMWMLLRGISSAAATVSRVAVVVWLVFFSAYDALAGIGTGVLVRQAARAAGEEQAGFASAAEFLWDSRLAGTASWWGVVATVAWPVAAVGAGIALRRAGARWSTTAATAASGLIALHGGYPAAIGFVSLAAAVALRQQEPTQPSAAGVQPAMTLP